MKNATYHLRLLAYLLILIGFGLLIRNLILSYESFNPSYLSHYLKQEMLSPVLFILGGLLSRLLSKPIAAWLCKDLG